MEPDTRASPSPPQPLPHGGRGVDPSSSSSGSRSTTSNSCSCSHFRKLCTAANLRVLAFFLMILLTLFLTTTVLSNPIQKGAVWLRKEGVDGYFVLSAVGFVFMMLGGSSHIFDLCCGFVYGNRKGLAVSLLVKLVTATAAYTLARTYFQAYLRAHFFNQYLWLEAFELMVVDRPWQSMVLIRFSVLPAAVKNYGCGAMGAPVVPYFACAVVSFAIFSYLLTDIGSKMQDPKDLLSKDKLGGPLEVVGIVCIVLFIVASIYYSRKYMRELVKRHQLEKGSSSRNIGAVVDPELGGRRVAPETTTSSTTTKGEVELGESVRGAD